MVMLMTSPGSTTLITRNLLSSENYRGPSSLFWLVRSVILGVRATAQVQRREWTWVGKIVV